MHASLNGCLFMQIRRWEVTETNHVSTMKNKTYWENVALSKQSNVQNKKSNLEFFLS
jgi:hypothetical protein